MGNNFSLSNCNIRICCKVDQQIHNEFKFMASESEKATSYAGESQLTEDVATSQEISQYPIDLTKTSTQPPAHQDDSRVAKLKVAVNFAKTLKLRVLSSTSLSKNLIININPLGSEQSLRGEKDGITYFGCKRHKIVNNLKGPIINDVIIPVPDTNQADQHRGQHFMIYYSLDTHSYVIKDLAVGFGTFYKVNSQVKVKDNMLVNIGQSYLLINLIKSTTDQLIMRVKVYMGSVQGQLLHFSPDEYTNSVISIGRQITNEIHIRDNLLSKQQASLYWEAEQGWVLTDGDFPNGRSSTNGTWVYISEPMEIYNKLVFKSNNTLFQALLV